MISYKTSFRIIVSLRRPFPIPHHHIPHPRRLVPGFFISGLIFGYLVWVSEWGIQLLLIIRIFISKFSSPPP